MLNRNEGRGRICYRLICSIKRASLLLVLASQFLSAVTIPTAHFDNARNGANTVETALTPAVLSSGGFKKVGTYPVDGNVYAQPLYVPNVTISGTAHNLVIVATLHNKVYAFDADTPGSTIWTADLGPQALTGFGIIYSSNLGCLSTPAVDVSASKIYAVCLNSSQNWVLHVLSLTTGSSISTLTVTGTVTGTGDKLGPPDNISGSNLIFYPQYELQRSAITLANGNVYVAFGSRDDSHPYHGWIMAYNKTTLAQVAVLCTTPNSYGGAIWNTPGPAVDTSGNLYFVTGNGKYDGMTEFGDSLLKLSPTLQILDSFTPSDQAALEAGDIDLAAGTPILIPGTHLVEIAGKDFNVFVIDTTCMGFLQGSSRCPLQAFITSSAPFNGGTGSFDAMYMNNHLYLPTSNGYLYNFTFNSATNLFNTTPVLSARTFPSPGAAQLAGSANGTFNGIVWVVTGATSAHLSLANGTLRALDPVTLTELWNSDTTGTDTLGFLSKFASPLVANGRVYVPTQSGQISIYGAVSGSTFVQLSSLTLNPNTIQSGQPGVLTINMTAPAGAGGANVALASSYPSGVNVPPSVNVPQGALTATVSFTAGTVTTPTAFTVTASYLGTNKTSSGTINPAPTGGSSQAHYIGTDTTTQGNWKTKYGIEGYSLAADATVNPAYVVPLSNGSQWVWNGSTVDVRALQRAAGTSRLAAAWYGQPTFTIDLNFTDQNSHQVAIYVVDWDAWGPRAQTIDVLDPGNNVLDTRTISSFVGGQYLVWNFTGHVKIRATALTTNSVISGIFFGSAAGSGATAKFLAVDTTTQGNWKTKYGTEGYSLAADATVNPAYVVPLSNGAQWVWNGSTVDVRALQRAAGTARLAATWYGQPTFTIDLNFTDQNSHQVAIYVVDWDTYGPRAQTIDVLDPGNKVLDTRTISSFVGGQYLVWNFTGHVKIRATALTTNSVISGIFFR